MLFMVIERFKNRDAKAVYRRFRDQGRGAPEGLRYVSSWIGRAGRGRRSRPVYSPGLAK